MMKRSTLLVGAVAFASAAAVFAQGRVERAFTATGERCEDVTWSQEALRQYPNIARACREVVERDGRYYVRFEGEVRRVTDRGRQVTIDFREGDTLTLTPPENMSLTIDGRRRSVRDLRPGDSLTFFVPQDQLAASFYAGQPGESEPETVPIAPPSELLAQNPPEQPRSALPRTASVVPLAGAGGLLLILVGAALAVLRRAGRSR